MKNFSKNNFTKMVLLAGLISTGGVVQAYETPTNPSAQGDIKAEQSEGGLEEDMQMSHSRMAPLTSNNQMPNQEEQPSTQEEDKPDYLLNFEQSSDQSQSSGIGY